jgi:membrane protein implicated in regulation of membrane protease activity
MGIFDNNGILSLLTNYLKTQFEIIKLDIQDKIEELLVRIFKMLLTAFSIGITFLFLLMGIAAYLNEYLKSAYLGYFAVAAFAFLIALVLLITLKKPVNKGDEMLESEDSFLSNDSTDLEQNEQ